MTTTSANLDLDSLRNGISGRVILPGDPEYETARVVMRGDIEYRPALIVRVADAGDVAQAIAFARENGLELAVRSGGHSSAGHGTTEGGLVIDVRDMNRIEFDADSQTCWAETGLTAAEVTRAAWEHGQLAIGFGDTGSVGIGGITLGGGIGFLVRKHGLTIDSLVGAELVTADGSVLAVDESSHPDLFWAIRGGGGNFGVATRFKYRLHRMDDFVGGMLVQPATPESVAGFIRLAEEAPDELSTIANVMNCPPLPGVPEEAVGRLVNFSFIAWSGDRDEGERLIDRFKALAEPLADFVKHMPYPDMYPPEEESYRPKALDRCLFMDHVDDGVARTMIEHLEASDAPLKAVQLRVMGGAMARVPNEATAFAHRDKKIMAICVNFFEGPDDYSVREQWLNGIVAALDQGVPGVYVNFLRDEGGDRVRAAYPSETWRRLAVVKSRYDPDNVFRLNQNIPPAADARSDGDAARS